MSKLIDKIKLAFKNINLFDEGNDIEAPDTLREMAVALSTDSSNSEIPNTATKVDDIEKILREAKNDSEKIWARTFTVTTNRQKNMEYAVDNNKQHKIQKVQNVNQVNEVNKEELDRGEL